VFGDGNAGGVADKIDVVEVDDIFECDWVARNASPARTSRAMPVPLGFFGVSPKRTSDDLTPISNRLISEI